MLSLRFHLPHPALRECVSTYYALDVGGQPLDDRLLPEWANVRFAVAGIWAAAPGGGLQRAPDASLFGPNGKAIRVTAAAGSRLFGFGLLPTGWARLGRAPSDLYADRMVPLEEVLGKRAGRLLAALRADADDAARVRRMDRLLLAALRMAPPAEPVVGRLHRVLMAGDIATVGRFASEAAVGERTLGRLCPKLFGFSPKPLLRRQRFLRTLEQILRNPGRPLAEQIGMNYADQPHFVREFRAFMGLAPSAYLAEPRTLIRLAAAERERVVGRMMQGLHQPPA